MKQPTPATLDQILYAQAFQIAIKLAGKESKFNFNNTMDVIVEGYLKEHTQLANQVYKFLSSQQG